MAASVLESSAAFSERALAVGVEQWIVDKCAGKNFASFGRLAFAIPYTPQNADDIPFTQFIENIIEQPPSQDQLATLRRLFFEAHTMGPCRCQESRGGYTRPCCSSEEASDCRAGGKAG